MGRKPAEYPSPGKRCRDGRWAVLWRWRGKVYEIALGIMTAERAEGLRLACGQALLGTAPWPAKALAAAAVKRWRALDGEAPPSEAGELLEAYRPSLAAAVSPTWAACSLAHLRELRDKAGVPLSAITPDQAQAFLDQITCTPGPFLKGKGKRSLGSRNRALAACSRFYRWAKRTGRLAGNPFADLKRLKERNRGAAIIHFSALERDRLLEAADTLKSGISIWIAFYAGLRRGEIQRLEWRDVDLEARKVTIRMGKTGRRIVELAERLRQKLLAVPAAKRKGRIVPWRAAWAEWRQDADRVLEALREALPGICPARIRWNVFRHTFCSLLVQAGVSPAKGAIWAGNSLEVFMRHYGGLSPQRDGDIDKL